MRLGVIQAQGPGTVDALLTKLADRLEARGIRLVGTVQSNSEPAAGVACDMDVRVMGGGPVIRINQTLGAGSRGCRLDLSALERAVGEVAARMEDDVELVIVNKFGKHEAEGRGFRDLIADALSRDVPVLTAVNHLNRSAFESFAADLAETLPADLDTIEAWVDEVLQRQPVTV